jgi:methyl-accepting chemotaxis protein
MNYDNNSFYPNIHETLTDTWKNEIIERVGNALSPEIQLRYYRAMRHLKSLPENDELLIILDTLQILTLLIEQVPERILTERELFEGICREVVEVGKKLLVTESKHFNDLDMRLTQLPKNIATGISPQAIVEQINGILKKLFETTTIPTIAKELADNAKNIHTASKEFSSASEKLTSMWNSAADKAQRAIEQIENATKNAIIASEQAAEKLTQGFNRSYRMILLIVFVLTFTCASISTLLLVNSLRPASEKIINETKYNPEPSQKVVTPSSNQRKR